MYWSEQQWGFVLTTSLVSDAGQLVFIKGPDGEDGFCCILVPGHAISIAPPKGKWKQRASSACLEESNQRAIRQSQSAIKMQKTRQEMTERSGNSGQQQWETGFSILAFSKAVGLKT